MMIDRARRAFGLALAWACLAGALPALAAQTQVAVAANFTEPARRIAQAFAAATGYKAILSFGASGAFYTQIAHGAPFEVLLSADAGRPARIEKEGLGVPGSRFTYAVGRLVLYSTTPGLVDGAGAVLKSGRFRKLSIADPAAAPYGAAAVQTMQKRGLYETLKPKIVQGASIAQAHQFVATGAAEIGFVAQSQVIDKKGGSRWVVPAADHSAIDQQAILLKTGADNPAARAFLNFLKTPAAIAIIKRYGYEVR
jgi:molybdate transport system substrate-binding protein